MSRFDDEYQFADQDRGYRSDEVRGPMREQWAGKPNKPRDEREESAGGAGGYGNSQNPAWAGQSASLESDVAGRGSYGAKGTEGTSGYGRYADDGGEGRMVASPDQSQLQGRGQSNEGRRQNGRDANREHRHFGREGGGGYGVYDIGGRGATGYHRVANETYDDMLKSGDRPRTQARGEDYGYGTRHWGHGEYQGSDAHGGGRRRDEGFFERLGEQIGEKVGRFFGVGPKGYRRSDDRIHEDVCETLQNHHHIDASEIEVSVKGGVVKLSGTVEERRTRRMVEEVIEHVPGIQEIENHLRTKNYVARTEAADQLKAGEDSTERPTLHS